MDYTNRKGDRYFVFEGKTKTGKPKYFVSRKPSSTGGIRIESLPEDFELFEDPSSQMVSIRRRKPTRIKPFEAQLIHDHAVELSSYSLVQALIDGDQIVLYTPDRDPAAVDSVMGAIFGSSASSGSFGSWTAHHTRFTAIMRFKLVDEDKRLYKAARYCFRSSMEGWLPLSSAAPLATLAKKYLPHLGEDSFYELF